MPPLPENNTDRLWVQYNSGAGIHEMMFRKITGASKPDFITQVRNFCTALAPLARNTGGFQAARYSTAGTDLSFPEPWTLIAGTNTSAPGVGSRPAYYTFTGRSSGGRKVRIFFFTPYVGLEDDFRRELGDVPALDSARTVLVNAPQLIGSIEGIPATWYPYYNVGYNAYWTRRSRVIGTP